jgi:hypothetical protein
LDLEHRTEAPAHATGAVEFVRLEDIADDVTFRLREVGDASALATSIGRLGQLEPVELRPRPGAPEGPRWQVVAGFRRLEALRLLQRDRALARIHDPLSDEDAWALALSRALLAEPVGALELEALRERLRDEGVAAWADELIDEALARAPLSPEMRERFHAFLRQPRPLRAAPGGAEEAETVELTPEEMVDDLLRKLYELNVDLAAAWEAWDELPAEGRKQVVRQARYLHELFPFLEKDGR